MGIYSWEPMTNKNKIFEHVNIERNLKRKVKEDLRNVEFWVKHLTFTVDGKI
jgi:hypothetical protein